MNKLVGFLFFSWMFVTGLNAALYNVRVENLTSAQRETLSQMGYELSRTDVTCDFCADETRIEALRAEGFTLDVSEIRDIAGYHSYAGIVAVLDSLAQTYPNLTRLTSLGPTWGALYSASGGNPGDYTSYADNQLWCMKVSNHPELEQDEPNVFISGNIHGDEIIAQEVGLYVLEHLLAGYGTVDSLTDLVDHCQIWFIPLINPDGQTMTWNGSAHRKNLRDNDTDDYPDTADGVDVNRNFGYVWGPNGTSSSPSSDIYNGPYAWSEPESRELRDLLTQHRFWGGITYHASGQWVMYPLGHIPGACSYDYEIMGDLATRMAAAIPGLTGGYYTPAQTVNYGYTCQGTMGDWSYAEHRIFGFTIELGLTHIPGSALVPIICEDNLNAALMFLERGLRSAVTGHVTDHEGNPLVAEIHVREIDEQNGMTPVEPVRSDSLFGRYDRLLLPGSYDFVFRCAGYDSVEVNQVVVGTDSLTHLEIIMPSDDIVDPTPVSPATWAKVWPNPCRSDLHVRYSLPHAEKIAVDVYNLRGQWVRELEPSHVASGIQNCSWNGRDPQGHLVPNGLYFIRFHTASREWARKVVILH